MEAIVLITLVFVLIAQSLGLLAYYSKRNQYSKSAQSLATFLPSVVFLLLVVLGTGFWLLFTWWADREVLPAYFANWQPPVLLIMAIYMIGGAFANTFLSILVQLLILAVHPPKYPTRQRRSSSQDILG
ncbi:MAG TPA: hypothetical protein VFZ34_08665 [Blastocatellia bacterium]|nr:hypothetical protein [Blastocatellia bacterium]